MEDILTVILIFGGGACIAMAFSPIGRALADRIRGKSASAGGGDVRTQLAEQREALDQDLEAVRCGVVEMSELLDFAFRLVAEQRHGDGVPSPLGDIDTSPLLSILVPSSLAGRFSPCA